MAEPVFGLSINRLDGEVRPAAPGNMSTVGLVVTAPDADADAYPLNTPVRVNSEDAAKVALLGGPNASVAGTVRHQIDLINANTEGSSADLVVVRVAEGADEAATMAAALEGVEALQDAPALLGVTPRLIAVPGLTWQQADPATANPVVAGMSATLAQLRAHAVVSGPHSTEQAFVDWRETIAEQRIIPVETWVKVGVGSEVVDSVGAVVGMIVARDAANGGRPFRSAANRPMRGIVGPNRPIRFSLTDGNVEGQNILRANGGIVVKGEQGVADAAASGGFTFIGTDTAATDDLWRFYPVSRGRDFIELTFLRTLSFYLGRYNLTGHTVQLVLNTMQSFLDDLEADGDILGSVVGFDADRNSPEELRLGRFRVAFRAEEPATLRHLTIDSGRYRPALDALLDDLRALA